MSYYLITGGSGFIGSHLAEALVLKGQNVLLLDNFDGFYSRSLKEYNVQQVLSQAKSTGAQVELLEQDIRNQQKMEEVFSNYPISGVYHLAALAGVRPSIERPVEYWDVNCTGTAVLLSAMQKAGVRRLVFASSSSVYGNSPKVPFGESQDVNNPISPYAATKKAGELLCYNFSHLYDIHTACIRFFTVYGPRQRPDLAIHKFSRLMLAGRSIPFFGSGQTSRDYTFVTDIVQGVLKAMEYTKDHPYEIFNLGESTTITLADLITLLEKNLGVKAQLDRLPMQPGDVERTWADITKSRQLLNYNPQVGKEEGMRLFCEWVKTTPGLLA